MAGRIFDALAERLRVIVEGPGFRSISLGLIVLNAGAMGLHTWPEVEAAWGVQLTGLNRLLQGLFVVEILMRICAHGRRPLRFFASGWNVFDFAVVAGSLVPAAGVWATLGRIARVLRAARLISGVPELRLIIGTMVRSIPSMGHVILLLSLLLYVYGVLGVHLFRQVDPESWGNLARALETLFVIITLEGWVEIMDRATQVHPWAGLYFISFIVVAVFVVINLFIAVVINNLETTRAEEANDQQRRSQQQPSGAAGAAPATPPELSSDLERISAQLESVQRELSALRDRTSPPRAA